jgi:phosphate transport system protein
MTKHFLRELEQLKRDVLVMGGLAETAVARAIHAFQERDAEMARMVIENDSEINAMELRIEEEVLKILSLYGPAAKDLRFVVGVFKITNDLERVGDLAVNVAERALTRDGREDPEGLAQLGAMSERVREMLNACLDAFVTQNRARAAQVLEMDDLVDDLLRTTYDQQIRHEAEGEAHFEASLRILSTGKQLERIADHCTNIAEDVIYMVTGDVVKHMH